MNGKVLALAAWLGLLPASEPTQCLRDCTLSPEGEALIQVAEGYMPFIYLDVVGIRTVGFGHVVLKGEKLPEPLLPEDALILLRKDASKAVRGINRCVNVGLYQNQADACISFSFNVGVTAFCGSTLLRYINLNRHADVPMQFMRWIYAGGKPINGLVNRRQAEADLYKREP